LLIVTQRISPPPDDHSASVGSPATFTVTWTRCERHPWLGRSVITTPDSAPWCIGLPDDVHGHPVEEAVR
jgi:hypothetical protein